MSETEFITALGLGLLLGARHALDADHVAAVSAILSRRPDLQSSGFIGFCWGFGHAVMLLVVGAAVILLKVTISEQVALACELGVGVMLVVLGVSLVRTICREQWHLHAHQHDGETHRHLHSHRLRAGHDHQHWLRDSFRPFLVGMAHGLAGSAALMLMVLSTVRSWWEGIVYILVFGAGSIVGMMLLGLLISLPMVFSVSLGWRAQMAVQGLASLGSIGLGLAIIYRIGDLLF